MKVYVLNKDGRPLMPCKPRKARLLLRDGKARAVKREPFTLQLLFGSTGYTQPITVGVDTGSGNVGVTVISGNQELNSYEFKLRKDVSPKVQERKMYRRNRRSRLRYRKPRFKNRASSRKKGSLAPGVQEKVDAHCRMINLFWQRLPESILILETGAFDTQKLQDPSIQGVGYQKGVQYGFANVKQYVLSRDQHHCQAGKGGCSKKLQVHHITFRSEGGSDAPDNLITLCDKHHKALHDGKLQLEVKKQKSLKSETVMSTVRKRLLSHYPEARETFGYITVNRHLFGIEKSHAGDAFVIGGGDNSVQRDSTQYWAFKRKNNRSLQKNRKGFDRSIRRQRYPLQPKDLVRFEGAVFEVKGMQNKGDYVKLSNDKVVTTKKVALIYHRKSLHPTHTS